MSFPEHYPDQCPPAGAIEPNGEEYYFRKVRKKTTEEDFLSQYDLNLPNSDNCSGRSVSMFTKQAGAIRLIKGYPNNDEFTLAKIAPKKEWGLQKRGKSRGKAGAHVHLWLLSQTDALELVENSELVDESE
jgi:hypothetical protein